jgi:DNA invertase Pin-like site-specific DNA recombinase
VVAIGYARRSKESGAKTVSLDEQAEQIRRYASQQHWTLAELVTDDGVSGGKRSRLARLEAVVRAHRARIVCVYHLDRYARDVARCSTVSRRTAGEAWNCMSSGGAELRPRALPASS